MSSKCKNVKCTSEKICNPKTGKCVLKTGAIGRPLVSKRKSKSPCKQECPPEKICNPESGKCVLRRGAIGRSIIGKAKPEQDVTSSKKKSKRAKPEKGECKKTQMLVNGKCVCINKLSILNPETNNCVSRSGSVGKKILEGKFCPKDKVWDDELGVCVDKPKDSRKKSVFDFKPIVNTDIVTNVSSKRTRDARFNPNPKRHCILTSTTKLTPMQAMSVDYFTSATDALLLVFETGMGKTLTALTAGKCYLEKHPASKVVIITQKSLLGTFTKEFEKYGTGVDPRFEAHTYDALLNSYTLGTKTPISAKNAMVIFDEVHTVRNYKSSKFAAAMKLVHNASKVLLLTATPFVNTMCDFIPIINLLYRNYVVGPAKKKLSDEDLKIPIFKANPGVRISGCGLSIKQLLESGGLSGQMTIIENLLRNKVAYAQKKIGAGTEYPGVELIRELIPMNQKFEKDFLSDISSESAVFADPERFSNGFRRAVNKAGEHAFSDKIKYALRIVKSDKSEFAKSVIFSNWIDFGVSILQKALADSGMKFETITGDTSAKDRQAHVAKFNRLDSGLNILIVSMAGSTGIDLRGVQNIIVIDPVWNNAILNQIKGRGVRFMSHSHLPVEKQIVKIYLPQLVERAFAEGSITKSRSGDYLLYEIIERKRGVEVSLSEMLKNISITNLYAASLPLYA